MSSFLSLGHHAWFSFPGHLLCQVTLSIIWFNYLFSEAPHLLPSHLGREGNSNSSATVVKLAPQETPALLPRLLGAAFLPRVLFEYSIHSFFKEVVSLPRARTCTIGAKAIVVTN